MKRTELEQMTIKELREEGKRLELGFPPRSKKADLIDRILAKDKADRKQDAEAKKSKKPTTAEIRAQVIAETEPWDGGSEAKTPAAFIRAGLLSEADQFAIWKGVTIRWPDYRGSGGFASIRTYLRRLTASEHLKKGKPTKTGKELLAELLGIEKVEVA